MIICYLNPTENKYFAIKEDGEMLFNLILTERSSDDIESITSFLLTMTSILSKKVAKEIIL